jgi:hypothetical protein
MNFTIGEYVLGFERTMVELPKILREWGDLAEDLQLNYREQLSWLLRVRFDVIARAAREGRVDVAGRIMAAMDKLTAEQETLRDVFGEGDPIYAAAVMPGGWTHA